MQTSLILTKETMVPVGVAVAIITPLIFLGTYITGIAANVDTLKLQVASSLGREAITSAKLEVISNKQTETDTNFVYISRSLDEIRKKLNIIP